MTSSSLPTSRTRLRAALAVVAGGSLVVGLLTGTSPASGAPDEPSTPRDHLRSVAPAFGVGPGPAELREQGTTAMPEGGTVTRFQQYVDERPVEGGQVVVALDDDQQLQAAVGETSPELDDDRVAVPVTRARSIAVRTAAERLGVGTSTLAAASDAGQVVYDPAVVGRDDGPSHVAWKVLVRPVGAAGSGAAAGSGGAAPPGGATVLVDARDGDVLSVLPHVRLLAQRAVCDGKNVRRTVSSAVCTVDDPYVRVEGGPASGVGQVDRTYDALGAVHTFYKDVVGVDIVSGAGFPGSVGAAIDTGDGPRLRGTARACLRTPTAVYPCPYPNASWYSEYSGFPYEFIGGSMFLGDGYERSLDVIGHEITHGVVGATAGLEYERESGAIDESIADVFGELIEQLRTPDARWIVGQDLPGLNGVRSMRDPQSFLCKEVGYEDVDCRQPDTARSGLWRSTAGVPSSSNDWGGVHTNSGVGNKAAYLITKGGRFGGQSVAPLGPNHTASVKKTARLYWRTLNLLTPYADYDDLAGALHRACRALVGTGVGAERFVASDCTASVDRAVLATAMRSVSTDTVLSHARRQARKKVTVATFVENVQGDALPGVRVRLQRKVVGKKWKNLSTRVTDRQGRATWRLRTTRTARFRTVPTGASATPVTVVRTRADKVKVTAKVTRKVKKRTIRSGKAFVVRGKVRAKSPGKVLRLQAYDATRGKWRTEDRVRIKKSSRYRVKHAPTSSTNRRWRLVKPKEPTLRRGVSKPFRIKIRN